MKHIWLPLVLVLALAVRLFHLGERVVWFDEAVSLLVAKANVPDIVAAARDDTHSPFYYLALHVLPCGELAARGLSVVCGVLTVALVFLIGRKFGGVMAGTVSAALMALCPLHVWYSQEVRMYALQTLLVTASWWLLFVSLDRPRFWIGYAVAAALSLYAQYTSAFVLAAQWLYMLLFRRDALRPWVLAQAGVALLFAPCLPLFMYHLVGGTFGFWLGKFSWADPPRFFALLSGAIPKNPGLYWPWVALSVALLAVAVVRQGKKAVPLVLWLLVPVALLALVSLRSNAFLPRALVMVTPAFVLLVGGAAADTKGAALAVLLAAANLFALQRYYFTPNAWIRSPLREAAEVVKDGFRQGDVVIHSSQFSYRPFMVYLDNKFSQFEWDGKENQQPMGHVMEEAHWRGTWMRTGMGGHRVWLVLWPDFQRPGYHNKVLEEMSRRRPFCYKRHREVFSSPQLLVMLYD